MLKPTSEVVILVDGQDRVVGVEEKHKAHMNPPQRHRAFSVFAFNEAGETLIQRRAFGKYHSAGLWANTCCGHPRPHEDIQEAARRRTFEELGFTPGPLTPLTHVSYTLNLGQGLWELEYTHVFRCEYQSSFVSIPSGVDPTKAEIHSNRVIPAKTGIHRSNSTDVIPAKAGIQSIDSSSRGPVTGSNLINSLDTAIKPRDDDGDKGDDTECVEPSRHDLNLNRDEVCDTLWISPAELLVDVKANPQNYARWFRLYVLKYFDVIFGATEDKKRVAHG